MLLEQHVNLLMWNPIKGTFVSRLPVNGGLFLLLVTMEGHVLYLVAFNANKWG